MGVGKCHRTICDHGCSVFRGAAAHWRQGRDKLVISPFLDDRLIGRLQDRWTENLYVYSRGDQLDLLNEKTVADTRTSFKAFGELGIPESADSGLSDTDESGIQRVADDLTGLHAKAYFCDYDHFTYALLGSANATEAGFTKNVEFLLEMRGAKKRLGVQRIRESLKDVPFAVYDGAGGQDRTKEDEAAFRLENALGTLQRSGSSSTPSPMTESRTPSR